MNHKLDQTHSSASASIPGESLLGMHDVLGLVLPIQYLQNPISFVLDRRFTPMPSGELSLLSGSAYMALSAHT